MSRAQKRKRHSFTDPSTIAPIKPPASTINTQQPRHTLQRASKDRAYAERLAAAGDGIGSFNGSSTANHSNTETRKSLRKSNVVSKVKGSKSIKKEALPHGWPFVDSFSKKRKEVKSNEKQSASRVSLNREQKSQHMNVVQGNDLPVLTRRQSNVLLASDQDDILEDCKQPESSIGRSRGAAGCKSDIDSNSGSKSSNNSKQSSQSPAASKSVCNECNLSSSGQCRRCKPCGSSPEGRSVEDITVNAGVSDNATVIDSMHAPVELNVCANATIKESLDIPTNESLKVEDTDSSTENTCRITEQLPGFESAKSNQDGAIDKQAVDATNKSPASCKTAKTWDCTRCTLTNSNRRKKCQVCGNIRHLSLTCDGTFALGDGCVGSGAVLRSAAGSCRDGMTVSNDVELVSGNDLQIASSQNGLSPADDLFAIASEPVSTRSRFKQSRLFQSMTQSEEDLNGSQQSLSTYDSLNKQNCRESDTERKHQRSGIEESGSFLKHIKKHKKNRHDRRKAKRVKRQLQNTGKIQVGVRVSVSADELDMDDVSLTAYVPSEIMPFVFEGSNKSDEALDVPSTTVECIDKKVEVRVRLSLELEDVEPYGALVALVPAKIMSFRVDHCKELSQTGCKDIAMLKDSLETIGENTSGNDPVDDATEEVQPSNETAVDNQESRISSTASCIDVSNSEIEQIESKTSFTIAEDIDTAGCNFEHTNKGGTEISLVGVELDAAEVLSRMQFATGDGESSQERIEVPTDCKHSTLQHEQKAEQSDEKQLINQEFVEGADNIQSSTFSAVDEIPESAEVRKLDALSVDNSSLVKNSDNSSGDAVDTYVKPKDAFVELAYIPMTQQMLEFDYDYFSQASKESNKCESCDRKITESQQKRAQGSENETEPTSISSPNRKPFGTTKFSDNNFSYNVDASCEAEQRHKEQQSESGLPRKPQHLYERYVEMIKPPSTHIYPTFQTAGKKISIEVSDESLSKVSKLFEDETSTAVANGSDIGDTVHSNPPILEAPSSSYNSTFLPVFHTAGNRTAITVSDESLSKISKLFECNKSTNQNPPTSAPLPMFQTAGKNRTIQISEEALSNASKLLNDGTVPDIIEKKRATGNRIKSTYNTARNSVTNVSDETLSKNESTFETHAVTDKQMASGPPEISSNTVAVASNPTIVPVFQTAGTNTVIQVSDESVSRISHFFDGDTSNGGTAIEAIRFATSLNEKSDNFINPPPTSPAFRGFQTAGRKSVIKISDESLAMVSKLFRNDLPGGDVAKPVDQRKTSIDEEIECLDASPSVFAGFQTAGKKAAIKISDESQPLVDKLFSYDEFSNSGALQKTIESEFAAERPKIITSPAFPVFQTAGKNEAIKVTEAALSKVSKLFADGSIKDGSEDADALNCSRARHSSLLPASKAPGPPMFQTAGKKCIIKVSDESLSKANVLFDGGTSNDVAVGVLPYRATDIRRNAERSEVAQFPLCQTARKKVAINVSDESLLKVDKFFGNYGSIDACAATASAAENSSSMGVNGEKASSPAPTIPMFQTAGKKVAINVPDEAFARVNNLFNSDAPNSLVASAESPSSLNEPTEVPAGTSTNAPTIPAFRTAGQQAAIDVSVESLSRANLLFDYGESIDEACLASNTVDNHLQDDSRLLQSDGKVAAISVAAETPFDDQSDLQESTGRSKKSNRVRFSLDPTELRVIQNAADHCEGSMQSKFRADDFGSFITPDKRQYALGDEAAVQSDRSTEIPNSDTDGPSSAFPSNLYTPLHRNAEYDLYDWTDMQSEIKSKRLFDAVNENQSQLDPTPRVSSRVRRWAVDQQTCSKINLGRFSLNNVTRKECLENGVSDVTLRINYANANKLRFASDDGLPLFIVGQRDVPRGSNVGKASDIKEWLLEHGCDESLFSNKWICNHYQMIVWKLAAMERSFSDVLGGQYLVYKHVLKQMKERYERELRLAKRPAVRKLLNRDVSASMPIILCVSQILRFRTKTDKPGVSKEEVRLELTDGWYALPATLDSVLLQFIEKQKIKVGTKLMICNAQLLGSEDGVDPLDDTYSSTKRDCPLCLNINANSTRLARWDALLGFVSPKNSKLGAGSLIVKSLRDIFVDGGPVPAIDLVVCKQYPKMYLEEMNGSSLHLTEAENAARQIEYNSKHQRASEKLADMAQKECIEELDEDAPEQWKEMQCSNSPTEYYEKLGTSEKKLVDEWADKRGVLLQNMISRSIEDSMRHDPSVERKSKPYVKILVKALSSVDTSTTEIDTPTAELTIWRVSDDQFDLVKEGSVVRFRNLAVKSRTKCGVLQLSANHETPMEVLLEEPTPEQLLQSGYSHRVARSFIQLNIMAKQQIVVMNDIEHEFDLVACVVKVLKVSDNTSDAYLTDESGLVIKVRRDHKADNSDPFSLGNGSLPIVVAYCNLKISFFDEDEHCVVAAWQRLSCKSNRFMQDRCDELYSWCNSDDGVKCCSVVRDKINAGIPFGTDCLIKTKICFGYIINVEEGHAATVVIIIDYGSGAVKASLSLHLANYAIQLFEEGCSEDTPLLVGVPLLHFMMQNNQKLLRFVLKQASSYGGESPMLEVIGLSLAKVDELARLVM